MSKQKWTSSYIGIFVTLVVLASEKSWLSRQLFSVTYTTITYLAGHNCPIFTYNSGNHWKSTDCQSSIIMTVMFEQEKKLFQDKIVYLLLSRQRRASRCLDNSSTTVSTGNSCVLVVSATVKVLLYRQQLTLCCLGNC